MAPSGRNTRLFRGEYRTERKEYCADLKEDCSERTEYPAKRKEYRTDLKEHRSVRRRNPPRGAQAKDPWAAAPRLRKPREIPAMRAKKHPLSVAGKRVRGAEAVSGTATV